MSEVPLCTQTLIGSVGVAGDSAALRLPPAGSLLPFFPPALYPQLKPSANTFNPNALHTLPTSRGNIYFPYVRGGLCAMVMLA